MLASAGEAPFDDDAYFFEPWWPGARAFAFLEGGALRLQADHLSDPLGAFPELRVIRDQLLADGVVLDGTLLVLDAEGRPDRDLLRQRLADPGTRVGTGAFVASDLLWSGGRSLMAEPYEARHRRLSHVLRDGDLCVATRGLHREGTTLAEAVASMGLEAVSARRLDAAWRPGDAGPDWIRLPVTETPAASTRPLLVLLQRLPLGD
ncbi:MAG: bifunctional non-ous end joining protein LigD [Chloroflexota bacterium]|nr:bifunctional non-ous end joining protein LigD [Chloroflexota bacterium]